MDDRGALVAALRRVLTDSQRAEALRKAGVQRVQTFRWSATAEQMAGCLEQIAPRGRTARSRG
jgi:glycosyltransferase involved in cell wall biosynthesis